MKISLNLTKKQAEILSVYFNQAREAQPRTRRQRVRLSIMREVSMKTERFYINFQNNKKKRKINFKAYEADMIEQFLSGFVDVIDDVFNRATLRKVIAEINQQLA